MRIATRVPTPCCREISPFSSSSFIALLTVTRDSAGLPPSAVRAAKRLCRQHLLPDCGFYRRRQLNITRRYRPCARWPRSRP